MPIEADLSALKHIRWHEYALRFFFGGAVTVGTGLLANRYGPVFGGLFLAFPAIFPAAATLVEKREREKKRGSGTMGSERGRKAAALDARGAAMGSIGLAGFAIVAWKLLTVGSVLWGLLAALALWLAASMLVWRASKIRVRHP